MLRLFGEMARPIKFLMVAFPVLFLLTFTLGAISVPFRTAIVLIIPAGACLFGFGLCVFRDINETATTWSRLYKEARE